MMMRMTSLRPPELRWLHAGQRSDSTIVPERQRFEEDVWKKSVIYESTFSNYSLGLFVEIVDG